MNGNPTVRVEERRCGVCHALTPYLYRWDKVERCKECLRDLLLRAPRGARRARLIRLIDSDDWAQGTFDWED